jgi:hypothetical protein
MNPEFFAVEDVNRLFTQGAEAEIWQYLHIIDCWDCGQMVQDKVKAGVSPAMEFPNAVEGEHGSLLRVHDSGELGGARKNAAPNFQLW